MVHNRTCCIPGVKVAVKQKVKGGEYIKDIIRKCDSLLEILEKNGKAPSNEKVQERRFTVQAAADLVQRSRTTLYRAEEEGVVVPESGSKPGKYSLEQVNKLREHCGSSPRRKECDPCLKIAIQSFKGGVAKSVTTVHLAQYLALKGYRILVADFDPQASATSAFGYLPDRDFGKDDTLLPYILGKKRDLQYCIIDTYYAGISLIPCCLPFYDAEYQLAFASARSKTEVERKGYFTEFVEAFKTVEKNFDIILFDSPPALGTITINILTAADALIVPTPPALYDFSSTIQYFKMIQTVIDSIVPDKEYNFIKILASRVDHRKSTHEEFLSYMKNVFGSCMLNSELEQATEVEKLSSKFKTIYDINPSKKTQRVQNIFDSMCSEIEQEILKWWPSLEKHRTKEEVLENV